MAKKTAKKLTTQFLKQKEKELKQRTTHEIQLGEDVFEIQIDKVFTNSKISELMADINELIQHLYMGEKSEDIPEKTKGYLVSRFIYLMIIKHFTDIEVPDDIIDSVATVKVMEDIGLMDKIITLMDEEELMKTVTEINRRLEMATELVSERLGEVRKELEKIENQDKENIEEEAKKTDE